MAALALCLILALSLVTGSALKGLLEQGHGRHSPLLYARLEGGLAALVLGLLLNGWFAFVLAEFGRFSLLPLITADAAVIALGFWRSGWPHFGLAQAAVRRAAWQEAGLLLALLGVAAVLFFRPHQFILGAADAGVYVNLGAAIAKTGAITQHDPAFATLPTTLFHSLLRVTPPSESVPYLYLPGFYVPAVTPGEIVPQFYHLHAVWLALAYSVGGLETALLLTPLWALLGGLVVYAAVRRLWGWPTALLALAALSLNAIQIWFARYPTTEMFTQLLLWAGVWAFIAWADGGFNGRVWPLLAGAAWGSTFLARIDTFFLLAVPALLLVWLLGERRPLRPWLPFFLPLLLLPLHSLLHGWLFTRPYFINTFGFVGRVLARNSTALGVAALVGLALLVLLAWQQPRLAQSAQRRQRPLRGAAVALTLLLALYGWFVRPAFANLAIWNDWYSGGQLSNYDHENLLRLGWYLSPVGVWLGVAGSGLLLWRLNRRTWVLVLLGGIFSLLYLWSVRSNPHQIYVMRRYVPAVVPFFIVAAAYAVNWLWRLGPTWGRWAAVGVMAVWLGSTVLAARGFVRQVDYAGLPPQVAALADQFAPEAVIIFNDTGPIAHNGDVLGTPLAFLHGRTVFTLRDPAQLDAAAFTAAVRGWQMAGAAVYWVAVPGGHNWPDPPLLQLESLFSYDITTQKLESSYEARPSQLETIQWVGDVYLIK